MQKIRQHWVQQVSIGMVAQSRFETSNTPFQQIEQPLSLKLAVAIGAFARIGLELWWFLSSSKCQDA